jgi:hypothetical protein
VWLSGRGKNSVSQVQSIESRARQTDRLRISTKQIDVQWVRRKRSTCASSVERAHGVTRFAEVDISVAAGVIRFSSASAVAARRSEPSHVLIIRLSVLGLFMIWLARSWADPDLWGHVRFGVDILHGWLPSTDPYSFTSDVGWTNHEWLAEVCMALSWTVGNGTGLIALKLLAMGMIVSVALAVLRRRELPDLTIDLLLTVLLLGLWPRVYVIRPQIFSLVFFSAQLWILASVEDGRPSRLWCLPVVFAVWVNAHGGWIVGIGVLSVWLTSVMLGLTSVPKRVAVAAAAVSLLATLLNPYGFGLWRFLFETVRPDRSSINDWRPLLDAGPQVVIPWCLSAATALFCVWRGWRRTPVWMVVVTFGLAVASVRVNRLDVFFTMSAVMLLGSQLPADTTPFPGLRWTRRSLAMGGVAVLLFLATGWRFRDNMTCIRLDGPWMPEREAGAFLAANHFEGRLLSWFDWGQYAIWHFAPELRVSLDGRRETVYSEAFIAEHLQLYSEPETAVGLLNRLHADYAWLPSNLPLTAALEKSGWYALYSGPISAVLSRAPVHTQPPAPLLSAACFPGP